MEIAKKCLRDYKKYQKQFSLNAFINHFNHPFLLVQADQGKDHDRQNSFETLCVSQDQLKKLMAQTMSRTASREVIKITNKGANTFQGTCKIGRASNCDMVINSPAVSKLHAYIIRDSQKELYYLMDMASKNGTYINSRKLDENQKKQLSDVDTLSFSRQISFVFYTPQGFYELLNQIP